MYIYLQNFHSPIRTRLLRYREVLASRHPSSCAPHTRCQSLAQPQHPRPITLMSHPARRAASSLTWLQLWWRCPARWALALLETRIYVVLCSSNNILLFSNVKSCVVYQTYQFRWHWETFKGLFSDWKPFQSLKRPLKARMFTTTTEIVNILALPSNEWICKTRWDTRKWRWHVRTTDGRSAMHNEACYGRAS